MSSLERNKMVGEATNLWSEELNLCFEKLMMIGGKNSGVVKMDGSAITEWKDIPMELLLRIVSLVDDQTVVRASGVCCGWRDAICSGLTHLSLSWYLPFYLLQDFSYINFILKSNETGLIIMYNKFDC